ncbi:hypothetical protein LTR08_001721 [Meristemomyces frigidus]|nr:hypothetical protein LTR08_001721 [Meristemomyces frigidus]
MAKQSTKTITGDGDGEQGADYYERPGKLPPVEKRWRLYQVKGGSMVNKTNTPPKYVILDDRAAYEVYSSNIPRTQTVKFWSHDFGGAGKLRSRRPHRGRGAVGDPDAEGDEKYHFAKVGVRDERYYFTGEKNYKTIIYRTADEAVETVSESAPSKRKATSPPSDDRDLRKHGHNQYTPREELVKYGAPTEAKGRGRYRARINPFLRRSPSPDWAKDRSKLYGGFDNLARTGRYGSVGASVEASNEGMTTMTRSNIRPISLGNDTNPNDSPPLDDWANVSDSEGTPRGDAAEKPRRKKLAQSMSYMERMAAGEAQTDTTPRAHGELIIDSGSYASKLERQLVEADEKNGRLMDELGQARERIEQLEGEVAGLREGGAANGEGDGTVG